MPMKKQQSITITTCCASYTDLPSTEVMRAGEQLRDRTPYVLYILKSSEGTKTISATLKVSSDKQFITHMLMTMPHGSFSPTCFVHQTLKV